MKKILILLVALTINQMVIAQNPFEQFGYKGKILTASNGRFNEFHDLDSIVQIGSVLLDVHKLVIVGDAPIDTVTYMPSPTVISRWLSPDPLAEKYYSLTPYNFVMNNPTNFVDPDGRDFIAIIDKDKNGNYTITIKTTVHTYGKDSNKDNAKANTEAFKKLGIEKKFGSEGQHTVKFDVTYEHHDSKDEAMEAVNNSPGSNLMQIDESLTDSQLATFNTTPKEEDAPSYAADLTVTGSRESNVRDKTAVLHATGHLLGLGDRYPGSDLPTAGYQNDFMSANLNPTEINRQHYLNLSQFSIQNTKTAEKGGDSRTFIYRDTGRIDRKKKN